MKRKNSMPVETDYGPVTLSRTTGTKLLSEFSACWPLPVVQLDADAGFGADFGVSFQVGEQQLWAVMHALPAEHPKDIELVIESLQHAIVESLCRMKSMRLPGVLLPCAAERRRPAASSRS